MLRKLPSQLDYLAERIAHQVAERVERVVTRQLFSLEQTADTLGVSKRTVENMVGNDLLEITKVGTRTLISKAEIHRFIADGGTKNGVDRE